MIQFTKRNKQAEEGEDAEIEVTVYDYWLIITVKSIGFLAKKK